MGVTTYSNYTISNGQYKMALNPPQPVVPPPARPCFSGQDAQALLWCAYLLENIRGLDLIERTRSQALSHYGAYPYDIAETAARLRALCHADVNFPRPTPTDAVRMFGVACVNPYSVLYRYPTLNGIIGTNHVLWSLVLNTDSAFRWDRQSMFINTISGYLGTFHNDHIYDAYNFPWREREELFCAAGLFRVPQWPRDKLPPIDGHYVHISTRYPELVAYTPDEKHGEINKHVMVRPGRYLQKYYPHLSSDEIRDYAAIVTAGMATLKFAVTGDEIHHVFTTGPHSCMSAPDHKWNNMTGNRGSPVRAYGESDLQMAYIEEYGKIIARALVWPEKKVYGHCYGDQSRFKVHMEKAGYKAGGSWCFSGARIRAVKIATRDSYGHFLVVPHLDFHAYDTKGYRRQFKFERDASGEWLRITPHGDIIGGRGAIGPFVHIG